MQRGCRRASSGTDGAPWRRLSHPLLSCHLLGIGHGEAFCPGPDRRTLAGTIIPECSRDSFSRSFPKQGSCLPLFPGFAAYVPGSYCSLFPAGDWDLPGETVTLDSRSQAAVCPPQHLSLCWALSKRLIKMFSLGSHVTCCQSWEGVWKPRLTTLIL